ncbi:hypothetical protein RRG08_055531 [Elysia crispata]|uniref:Uncharacterized protein n=1 Tax=Elysia crispata TaxID=231223 RepID=A0AAE1DX85_9GAST|nr:hypothetical protein RRG08_055531 [Elysia crispata]
MAMGCWFLICGYKLGPLWHKYRLCLSFKTYFWGVACIKWEETDFNFISRGSYPRCLGKTPKANHIRTMRGTQVMAACLLLIVAGAALSQSENSDVDIPRDQYEIVHVYKRGWLKRKWKKIKKFPKSFCLCLSVQLLELSLTPRN